MDKKLSGVKVDVGIGVHMCKNCAEFNTAMRVYKMLEWRKADVLSLSILGYDRQSETILIDEDKLMQIIKLVNPAQVARKLKLVNNESNRPIYAAMRNNEYK